MRVIYEEINELAIEPSEFTIVSEEGVLYRLLNEEERGIGYIHVDFEHDMGDGCFIRNVEIVFSFRGEGYGRDVVEDLVDEYGRVFGYADEEVWGFWERLGAVRLSGDLFMIKRG